MNPQAIKDPWGDLTAFGTVSFLWVIHFISFAKQFLFCIQLFMAPFQNANIQAMPQFAKNIVWIRKWSEKHQKLTLTFQNCPTSCLKDQNHPLVDAIWCLLTMTHVVDQILALPKEVHILEHKPTVCSQGQQTGLGRRSDVKEDVIDCSACPTGAGVNTRILMKTQEVRQRQGRAEQEQRCSHRSGPMAASGNCRSQTLIPS